MKNIILQSRIYKISISLTLIFVLLPVYIYSQSRVLIHSHNDYRQRVPFYQAYSQQVYSIEADIFSTYDSRLLVGHDIEDLESNKSFEDLYILPLIRIFKDNNNKAWSDSDNELQLMIELKSPTEPALTSVSNLLSKYPEVFDKSKNPYAINVVITGNLPDPNKFDKYPKFISFDGRVDINYTQEQLERVSLISHPFRECTNWNGKGTLTAEDKEKVYSVINKAHAIGKPIRFWGTPDGITAWNTLHNMGVDIINTDKIERCVEFFRNFDDKNYRIQIGEVNYKGMVTTDRLDKTTSGFKGFDREKIQLVDNIDVYTPTYKNDGENKTVKNVILLIGDGMGLSQINAAKTVNKGLTLLSLKNIGLQTNSPKDGYTTDSAAGGSALATGKTTNNRHISMTSDGEVTPSLIDIAYNNNMSCGVITLGNLADATPAAFYGHSTDRDNSDEITNYLLDGKLSLLVGGGMDVFTGRKDSETFIKKLEKEYSLIDDYEDIKNINKKIICADGRMDLAATQGTIDLLAKTTKYGIEKLNNESKNGFFLMVEGAKIDYAGHANSLGGTIVEMLSFDLAIAEALEFADKDGETLVIITADHETGGLTLIDGDIETGLITGYFVTDDHTPIMLPVFAYGPQSNFFNGVYNNTEIFHKILKSLNVSNKLK